MSSLLFALVYFVVGLALLRWRGWRLTDLFHWQGAVGGGAYTLVGIVAFAVKYNLDLWLARSIFHQPWSLLNYLVPAGFDQDSVTTLAGQQRVFFATMVAAALPFIWIGVALTLRRLRQVKLATWLVLLFFLPVFNLLLFLLLALLPNPQEPALAQAAPVRESGFLGRAIPRHQGRAAVIASLLAAVIGGAVTQVCVSTLSSYGWSLFVGLPFGLGLLSVLLFGYHQPRSYRSCLAVSQLTVLFYGLGLLLVAIEGAVCLFMAAPIGLPLAALGGCMGYHIQRRPMSQGDTPPAILSVLLFIPLMMGFEHAGQPIAPLFAVHTSIDVGASLETVWENVVSFPKLPEPQEWLFRLGVAYPTAAKIEGRGPGALRHCIFSTGEFLEPIEVWDAPRLLKFSVTSNPPPMEEWTLYRHIHPPHLNGFLMSQGGQFLLTPLPDGSTRLEGTTWYQHHMWPVSYWRVWSDWIIHRIHLRVLRHIKELAEHTTEI